MYEEEKECLTDNEVAAFAEGSVRPEEHQRLEGHLAECAACREIVVAVFNSLVEPQHRAPIKAPHE